NRLSCLSATVICITISLQNQSPAPIVGDSEIASPVEISKRSFRRRFVNCRWIGGELRDLRDCVCKIWSGTEHVVHLAANVRLVLFLIVWCRFARRFDESCTGYHGRRDWRRIFHVETFEDNVRVAALVNLELSIFPIANTLNPKNVLQFPHILHLKRFFQLTL